MIIIRKMQENEVQAAAKVHSETFLRQSHSYEWISCNFKAYPRIRYFVAVIEEKVVGYIQWIEKSGFRKEVILELEQIAVRPSDQNRGIGTQLIKKSLLLIQEELADRNASIKHLLVTTRDDNPAQELYFKTINAKIECTIRNLFSADEVLMISRNISLEGLYANEQ